MEHLPQESSALLEQAVVNHVASFNEFLDHGLDQISKLIPPCVIEPRDESEPSLSVTIEELSILKPVNYTDTGRASVLRPRTYPCDARLSHGTYLCPLKCKLGLRLGEAAAKTVLDMDLGQIPAMVRSKACNLDGVPPEELTLHGEDETEAGGYFIVNGTEKVVRLLIVPRNNYPMAVTRSSFANRGRLYTEHAVMMRCMRTDGTTQTVNLHYLKDGSCTIRFSSNRQEWLIPLVVVAQCLHDTNPLRLLWQLVGARGMTSAESKRRESVLIMMQQQVAKEKLDNQAQACRYLGSKLRAVMSMNSLMPSRLTDEECGKYIINQFIMVHTDDSWQKLQTLCIMFQKLIALVSGDIVQDNQDQLSAHDVLMPGQLYGMVLRESLEANLLKVKLVIDKMIRKDDEGKAKHSIDDFMAQPKLFEKVVKGCLDIKHKLVHFLSTGNITSRSGLDLMQTNGFAVVADKLNQLRFSSHFAAIHRGQYFTQLRTTTVRKLLPETWGFLCPVHTPDGAPCGLLNHLAAAVRPVVQRSAKKSHNAVSALLKGLGLRILSSAPRSSENLSWVMLDGCPLGLFPSHQLEVAAQALRDNKTAHTQGIPENLEIVCITERWKHIFPGMYLFSGPGRMLRPVRCPRSRKVDWIGPLEQIFLSIACTSTERIQSHKLLKERKQQQKEGKDPDAMEVPEQLPVWYTHEELEPNKLFSTLAALTPFSNHNQSPRNMYQCQMLKQTMGTPYLNGAFRVDNKTYMIKFPQKPLVRTQMYDSAKCNTHPAGTNAVVAVITYTGYDMEDAMIINKSSYERGFKHGCVIKTKIVEAAPASAPLEAKKGTVFTNFKVVAGEKEQISEKLNDDGFPPVGTFLEEGDPLYAIVDHTGTPQVASYKDAEPGYLQSVSLVESPPQERNSESRKAILKIRVVRNPVVGDKFASRHGQKGVMSILWPQEDMPFTESGITPDILFNPHGFPSRMTIGMLIESMAGKLTASEGLTRADASTFRMYKGRYGSDDNEEDPFLMKSDDPEKDRVEATEYFGETLAKNGFQRLGTERMYSGIHGTELETEIFIGIIYYQRLRHMVGDKAQVRARGPVDKVTHQPVKGRSRHGGIRFGEMERDSLIAHGTAFLLHDRLMRCSDFDMGFVCPRCGSILTPQPSTRRTSFTREDRPRRDGEPWVCPPCTQKEGRPVRCHTIPIPWVFRYLSNEVAAMGVRIQLKVTNRAREASLTSMLKDNSDASTAKKDDDVPMNKMSKRTNPESSKAMVTRPAKEEDDSDEEVFSVEGEEPSEG